MSVDDVMSRLQSLGDEKTRKFYKENAVGENQFGVNIGQIWALAQEIGQDPELAEALWATGNFDAMMLGTLLMRPEQLSIEEVEKRFCSAELPLLCGWFLSHVVKKHPEKEALRRQWMQSTDPILARGGWILTSDRLFVDRKGLDLAGLLDRIEAEMAGAPAMVQSHMNQCLITIGIHYPEHRERAIAIGEKLGVFRDDPVPNGYSSSFAPRVIAAAVGPR